MGPKGEGGAAGPAGWAARAKGGGAAGPKWGRRGEGREERIFLFLISISYMNAIALSKQSKEMQGSAWCIKQHKVFRVFLTREFQTESR